MMGPSLVAASWSVDASGVVTGVIPPEPESTTGSGFVVVPLLEGCVPLDIDASLPCAGDAAWPEVDIEPCDGGPTSLEQATRTTNIPE
jgi:hypothetical protein